MTRMEAMAFRDKLNAIIETMNDESALDNTVLFPVWASGKSYAAGDRVRYGEDLYKCVQAHTSQTDWTPDISTSLWTVAGNPTEEWPEWVQPIGSSDAYRLGEKVSHSDKHWISDIDFNVYEPGVYGWSEA